MQKHRSWNWGTKELLEESRQLLFICLWFVCHSIFFLEWYMSLPCPSLCIRKILYLRGTVTFILVLWTWVGIYFKVGRCPLTPFILSPGEKCWEKIFSSHYSTGLDHKELRGRIFFMFTSRIFKTLCRHNICLASSDLSLPPNFAYFFLCCKEHYVSLGGDTEILSLLALGTVLIIYEFSFF